MAFREDAAGILQALSLLKLPPEPSVDEIRKAYFILVKQCHPDKGPIEEKEYTWPIDKWMTDPQTYPASVMKELIDTQTFYIVDASKFTKKLNDFCKKIEIIDM